MTSNEASSSPNTNRLSTTSVGEFPPPSSDNNGPISTSRTVCSRRRTVKFFVKQFAVDDMSRRLDNLEATVQSNVPGRDGKSSPTKMS
ncbi:hypothetical protein D0Z07_4959 [Hyphodiscus hymeniophilus]|uniref:Uncharacterized protein n=1 Tax=Hyphodiscus hymeniophilus TaxID=353542 RepID=A0A9P6VJL0_9HELO|nr:hypothetical protein D0Z07_4959 [Hyphodiscus hymeniophilus]